MTGKKLTYCAAVLLTLSAASFADRPALRLHLPRQVQVDADSLTLGDIAVIRSAGPGRIGLVGRTDLAGLVQKARGILMGRSPFPAESLSIDRQTVLSRLAAAGINGKDVELTGALAVAVRRREAAIASKRLIVAGRKILAAGPLGAKGVLWQVARPVEDLVFPAGADNVTVKAEIVKTSTTARRATVRVTAVSEGRELAGCTLLFTPLYAHREAVAAKDISAGEEITPANTKLRTVRRSLPEQSNFVSPFGQISSIALRAGTVIRPGILRPVKARIAVGRNQAVVMKIDGPGFTVRGLGQALADGRPGEVIRVRNLDSKRIVNATVLWDGSVKPIMKR